MVLRAGLEPARIAPHAPQTCAATNYATSAIYSKNYLFAGASLAGGAELDPAGAVEFASDAGAAVLAFGSATFALAAGTSAAASAGASGLLLRTESFPVNAGMASSRAESMNIAAAPIV